MASLSLQNGLAWARKPKPKPKPKPKMQPAAGDRGTLAPLPEHYRRGLTILTVFSVLSFVSTASLWLFITYKLLSFRWHKFCQKRQDKSRGGRQEQGQVREPDFSLGLDRRHEHLEGLPIADQLRELDRMRSEQDQLEQQQQQSSMAGDEQAQDGQGDDREADSNPFPILVYHLLLSDMQEAMAYGLSIHWLWEDGIYAPSSVCWAQGWFGSVSNLAASLFLSAISVTTFSTIVLGHKPSRRTLYAVVAGIWLFTYGINTAGVLLAMRSTSVVSMGESYFMRANVWCWISSEYNPWRLWSHYFWVMFSITLTAGLHAAVFLTLWRQKRSCRHMPRRDGDGEGEEDGEAAARRRRSGHHPAFLAYPLIYLACIAPLAAGRVSAILGRDPGTPFLACAGAILAANGLLNSALWTTTILFGAPRDVAAAGLDRFAFGRAPARAYGHTVVISGPGGPGYAGTTYRGGGGKRGGAAGEGAGRREWWWWRAGGQRGWGRSCAGTREALNPELIRVYSEPPPPPPVVEGPYIHMNVVTRVVVEDANWKEGN